MKVVWPDEAREELRHVFNHHAARSEPFALRLLDRVLSASERLGSLPRLGRVTPEYGFEQVRELIVADYRLVYHLLPDRVEIIALFHSSVRPRFP